MIKHITKTDKDQEIINKSLSKNILYNKQPDNYKNIIVPKPWGQEHEFYNNNNIAAWFLSIEANHSTSMHCHPNKRTVLILLSGIALSKTLNGSQVIKAGDVIVYEPGVFHATKGISKIEMAEIESPPIKTDLLRHNDNYGREKMGYEDQKIMQKPTFDYFYLNKDNRLFSQSHYAIIKSDTIKKGMINVFCSESNLPPNTCILETKDIKIVNGEILNFHFPHREKEYEYRKYL